jgi:hypothetical protein
VMQWKRRIENSGEIAKVLQERYPGARVDVIPFTRHPKLTIAQQVGDFAEGTASLQKP